MKSISNKLASMLLVVGAWTGTMAHAVQDLPGGPAVKQLNLAPPVTRIAEEQHFLHLHGDFHRCICGDVLFHLEASQIAWGQSRQFP